MKNIASGTRAAHLVPDTSVKWGLVTLALLWCRGEKTGGTLTGIEAYRSNTTKK